MTVAAERWQEMEIRMEHMQQEVEEARQALARNYMQQQELKEQSEKAQQLLQKELDDAHRELAIRTADLRSMEVTTKVLEGKLRDTEENLQKTSVVLRATQKSEQALTLEASALLRALKDSIDDGDKLHNMIRASREEEVNRRLLTREFNRSIADVVKNARSKLEDIATSSKEHHRLVGEVALSDHQQRLVAIEEAQVVVSKMSELVARASTNVSFGISHETAPLLGTLSDGINFNIEEMRTKILSGERDLSRSCSAAEEQLTTFSKALFEINSKHDSKVKDSMFDVQTAISESKAKAEIMVRKAEQAIEEAQARSRNTRASLKNMLNDWNETGTEAAHRISDLSSTQHRVLGNTFDLLKSEMERHEAVKVALEAQLVSLNGREASQLETLELQSRQLMRQQKQLEEAKQRQELLCGSVVDTIVNEVKNLVTAQMRLIMADQSERTEELKSSCAGIKELNGALCNESVKMFDKLRSTNASLAAEGRKLQSTDASILTVLNAGKTAMTSIEQVAEDQQRSLYTYGIEMEDHLKKLNAVAADIENAREGMLSAGNTCAADMDKSIDLAEKSISEIAAIGSEAMRFSQDVVIREAAMSLADIEEPRPKLLANVSNHIDSMERIVTGGTKQLLVLVQMHSDEIAETNASISSAAADFNASTCEQHRLQCDVSRVKLAAVMQSHGDATQFLVSDCGGIIASAAEKTQIFGDTVIAMDDQVKTVPPRTTIEFTEQLTATPREEVLLEGFRREHDDPTWVVLSNEDTSVDVIVSETSGVLREIFSSNNTSEGAVSPGKRRRNESNQLARRAKQKVK
jgi:chromosome segregation ATPase